MRYTATAHFTIELQVEATDAEEANALIMTQALDIQDIRLGKIYVKDENGNKVKIA